MRGLKSMAHQPLDPLGSDGRGCTITCHQWPPNQTTLFTCNDSSHAADL
jgi:hypothetical protein